VEQPTEGLRVPGDPVVLAVPSQFAADLCVLLGQGGVPVPPAPLVELPQEPGDPVGRRPALHRPLSPTGLLPEVSEAQEVEAPRDFVLLLPIRLRTARPVESHQTSLVRVEAKAVFGESLRQYLQNPTGILLQLEHHDEVIGKTDQMRRPMQPGLDLCLKPFVQYLVEVDVRQDRRDDSSLRCACGGVAESPLFHYSRFQPLVQSAA
jgi:hypothetical protein